MADGVSVGIVQLDVEISQKSINREMNRLGSVFSNSFKNMFGGIANQMNSFARNSIGKIGNGFKDFVQSGTGASEKVSKSVEKMNSQFEKTQAEILKLQKEMAGLDAQRDAIISNYKDMPTFSGMSKDESLEQMLKSDTNFQKLTAEIDNLNAKIDPLIGKNKKLADEIRQAGESAESTGRKINLMRRKSEQAGEDAKKASRKTRLFNSEMKKGGAQAAGFAAMINKSFGSVIKRLFVYNLILKGIRGIINYTGAALKTNKQFVNSLNIVKTNLMVAFQPIYDFILPALNTLMRAVATVTTYIASAISSLFGKTYKQSFGAAKELEDTKKAMAGYGKAAKKAGKDASGALSGFDEINQLDLGKDSDDGSGSGEFEMTMPDTSTIDLSGFEKFKSMLQPTVDSLKSLGLALEPLKNFAAQGLKNFYNSFLVPVGKWVMGEGLPRFIDAITKGLMVINWQSINDGLNNLWKALAPFAINVGEGLLWFWENVLTPLGTWTISEVVPRFLNILAGAIRVLNITIEALKPLGLWLWNNFLKPLAEWTGGIAVGVLDGIKKALEGIGNWIQDHQETTRVFFALFATWKATTFVIEMGKATAAIIANTTAAIAGKFETIALIALYAKDAIARGVSTAATIAMTAATTAWNVVAGIATTVTTALGAAIAFLTSPIGIVITAITAVIAVGILLYKHWDEISAWLKELWEGIKTKAVEIWGAIKEFFIETWDSIKAKTKEVWDNIKEFLIGTWSSVKENATQIWNSVKTFFAETWDNIKFKTKETWNAIKNFLINTIWNPIKNTAQNIWNGIKMVITTVISAISYTIDKFSNSFKTTWDKLWNGAKTVFSNVWDSLTGIVKGVINGIIGIVNKFINFWNRIELKVPSVNIPLVGEVGGFSIGVPKIANIPMLAKGGIIDQPTLAMVGEKGKEAVVPLENNTEWMEKLASILVSALMGVMQLGGSTQTSSDDGDIILQIDGTTFARIIGPYLDKENLRIGNVVIQPI